jgi:Na+-translocating ferredoxin:NAD+ oxidoreductase RnfC subunit
MSLSEQVREAGVVGAGGAGFPTYVKAGSHVDHVIANGAECEPLLHKDSELLERYAAEVVAGLELMCEATGAARAAVGLKAKNAAAVKAMKAAVGGTDVELHTLGDFYPAGDEYELVHEITGRLIPPAGIPLHVGCVVNNVETLYNVACAADGQSVTHKFLSIAGAVARPVTAVVPLGVSFRDTLSLAGGATADEVAVFVGGVMMGPLTFDLDAPVTKTTTGLIVLPADHSLVQRKGRPEPAMHRIGKSACDQCSYCTEFCPRYLLGYDVQPHKVMRSLGFTASGGELWTKWGELCCACGLCTLYACPEDLFPKEACDRAKRTNREQGLRWTSASEVVTPHPMRESRRVPLTQLVRRLGLAEYDAPAPFTDAELQPRRVRLPLRQHIGSPAQPLVSVGDRVICGQKLADVPTDQLGAPVHASVDGVVRAVGEEIVVICDF